VVRGGGGEVTKPNELPPWTLDELQTALRRAGWERIAGPGSSYVHLETGRIIDLRNVSTVNGVRVADWRKWAERREVPIISGAKPQGDLT
jgi:hypothetical protein